VRCRVGQVGGAKKSMQKRTAKKGGGFFHLLKLRDLVERGHRKGGGGRKVAGVGKIYVGGNRPQRVGHYRVVGV